MARPRRLVWVLVAAVLPYPVTTLASFNLFDMSYVVTGRIWVPVLAVDSDGLVRSDRSVALMDFGDCLQPGEKKNLLAARPRDCRFEGQLADALETSRMFRHVTPAQPPNDGIDFILVPRLSKVHFRRQMIPIVKPLVVLTLLTYVWTPLPFEVDVERYELRMAILGQDGNLLDEVAVDREFTHYLSSYSADRWAPADLLSDMDPNEPAVGGISVCEGPHARIAAHALLQQLGEAVVHLEVPRGAGL